MVSCLTLNVRNFWLRPPIWLSEVIFGNFRSSPVHPWGQTYTNTVRKYEKYTPNTPQIQFGIEVSKISHQPKLRTQISKFTFKCYIFNRRTEPGLHKWSEIQKYTLEIQEIRPNTAWGACLNRFQSSITFEPDVVFDFLKRQNLLKLDFPTDGNIIWLAREMLQEGGLIYCCNIGNPSLWEAKTILKWAKNGPRTYLWQWASGFLAKIYIGDANYMFIQNLRPLSP